MSDKVKKGSKPTEPEVQPDVQPDVQIDVQPEPEQLSIGQRLYNWIESKALNLLATVRPAPGNYLAVKTVDPQTILVRPKGTKQRFTSIKIDQLDKLPEVELDVLLLCEVQVLSPKPKKIRISVPLIFLTWAIGTYFRFSVNMDGYSAMTDEPVTAEFVASLQSETIPA